MSILKNVVLATITVSIFSCESQKTEREIEDEFVEKYAPKDLKTYGFTLPVDSKVAEVHQLFNDLEKNFFFYGDKNEFEKKAAKIMKLDPSYPSGFLFGGFYEQDPEKYKEKVTKAYELSKKSRLQSERDIIQAEYYLLVKEDYLKAQEYFQKVVDMYPDSAAAIWSLGMSYYYNSEFDKALECYKKSTELIPNLPKGYEFMSVIHYSKKEYKKALKYLEKAIQYGANPKNDFYYAEYVAMVYNRNKMYEKTIDYIETVRTYGKLYKNSEMLKKVSEIATKKLDSIKGT
ncbi:tetratricopeptide repeat protein [Aquimarina sp. MAR_2010_214]|uniref:tetratricopeptide repeat protein n=1 Tax=Aquimarina sp. MAR_2010_214 TaxID=1250026 RepID=UPI000C707C1F|nr:tetratricopeptide repeat protein [Aquimarina sp. MAR_2010_214]PKV51914.1 tetratricopeptide repeat protein [Aquimarina sp. MAR_2010_214]